MLAIRKYSPHSSTILYHPLISSNILSNPLTKSPCASVAGPKQKNTMNKLYEVGIKYDQIQENGDKKRVTIPLLVRAFSFSEAEAKAAKEMATYYTQDEFDIVSIRITKIKEYYKLQNAASTKFYRVKYNTIILDEKTAKEKKLSDYVVFEAESIDKAREYFKDYTKLYLSDVEMIEVVETKIVDIIQ